MSLNNKGNGTHLSETKKKILINLAWSSAGKATSLLGGLLVGIIVARYLGPSQYGLMNYVISYVFLFQTFAMFGLDSIEIREEAHTPDDYRKIIGTAFGIKVGMSVIFMALVIITSLVMEADIFTTKLVAIYSFTIILNSFCVIRNYFTALVDNGYVVKAEISRTILGAGIKIALLLADAQLVWFIIASMFDFLLLASGYIMAYRKKIGSVFEWTFDKKYACYLLKESLPLLLTNAAVIIYQRIDQVMIGYMIDHESVGFFSVASRFVEVLIYIPMILAQTIMPVLVQARNNSEDEYRKKAQLFMDVSLWITLALAAITSIISYWLIRYTFGLSYIPAVAVLQVMAFKAASVALSNTAGAMLITEGLQRYAIYRDTMGCIVCVALNYLLLPRYGILAAAYIAIISNIVAGYIADAIIPAYRHLFKHQTEAILLGWKSLFLIKSIYKPYNAR
ncbi:MAG: flippase [Prevotella sp.]